MYTMGVVVKSSSTANIEIMLKKNFTRVVQCLLCYRTCTGCRCVDQRWHKGGNASNTANVIATLPNGCLSFYMGTLAQTHETKYVVPTFSSRSTKTKTLLDDNTESLTEFIINH